MNTENQKVQLTEEEVEYLTSRGATTRFDNDGNMVISNRAGRRKRPATDPKHTKATHTQQMRKVGKKKARR